MDNNNIFSTGNFIAKWSDADFFDLESLRSVSGKNPNSISVFTHYISSTNLHTISPYLDGAAAVLTRVTEDVDGEPRNGSAPDIGADEFTPDPGNKIPLSGTYTIGSGGDYPNFTEAASDLLLKGISSSVSFDVIPGTYNENFTLFEVPMENESDSIVFKSQTGNPEDVNLSYDTNSTDDNYIVNLRAAKNITFENLTISSNSGSSPEPVFVIQGYNKNIKFLNNLLNGSSTNSTTPGQAVIYAEPSLTKNFIISGNTITGGSYGIYMYGVNSNLYLTESSILVKNNFFSTSGFAAIRLRRQSAPVVNKNSVMPGSGGIYLEDCEGAIRVTKNMVDVNGISNGILLSGCAGGDPLVISSRAIVANNFVTHRGGNNIKRGAIEIVLSEKVDVVYNSVNSESPLSPSLYIREGNDDINVINNLFVNKVNGYAYDVRTPSALKTSDNNDIYTIGEKFAFWDGNKANLAELQTASGKDSNSISADPGFISINNLHAKAKAIDSAGMSIIYVIDDIDGELRDGNNPDIGADEFIYVFNNPPTITSKPDTFASVGSLYEYQVIAEDIDNDTITFSLVVAPGFLSIDSKTGLLHGTPSLSDTGKHPVEIIGDDNNGNQAKQNFILTVDNATAIYSSSNKIPDDYFIFQNYPNPFNPSTIIHYALPFASHVKIEVFNITGKKIINLVDEKKASGNYELIFNGEDLPSGVYFYRINAGSFNQVKKMILLR